MESGHAWKDKVTFSRQSPLKSSAARAFRKLVQTTFPAISEEDLAVLLPPKDPILCAKCSNKCLVYWLQDKQPLFFDTQTSQASLFPSVYTLWRFPHLLPVFWVHSATASRLLAGADLFGPGVLRPTTGFGELWQGQKRAVMVVGNPCSMAVGVVTQNQLADNQSERKGTALVMTHYYSDALWQLGSKTTPNTGFQKAKVLPIISTQGDVSEEGEEQEQEQAASGDDEGHNRVRGRNGDDDATEGREEQAEAEDYEGEAEGKTEKEGEEKEEASAAEEEQEDLSVDTEESRQHMSEILEDSLIFALKEGVQDTDFPLSDSQLYAVVHTFNVWGGRLDVKRSTYKKFSKFLATMAKRGVLILKRQSGGQLVVTAACRDSLSIQEFKVTAELLATKRNLDKARAKQQRQQAAARSKEDNGKTDTPRSIRLLQYYLPSPALQESPVLEGTEYASGRPKHALGRTGLLTMTEAMAFLNQYITSHGLGRGAQVVLDQPLYSLFFAKDQKEPATQVPRKELSARLATQLRLHWAIVPDDGPVEELESQVRFRAGPLPCITLKIERRQGNKMVTRMMGLDAFGLDVKQITSWAAKQFSVAATTQAGKQADAQKQELQIQGSWTSEIQKHLKDVYNVPLQCIKIEGEANKKKGGKGGKR